MSRLLRACATKTYSLILTLTLTLRLPFGIFFFKLQSYFGRRPLAPRPIPLRRLSIFFQIVCLQSQTDRQPLRTNSFNKVGRRDKLSSTLWPGWAASVKFVARQ